MLARSIPSLDRNKLSCCMSPPLLFLVLVKRINHAQTPVTMAGADEFLRSRNPPTMVETVRAVKSQPLPVPSDDDRGKCCDHPVTVADSNMILVTFIYVESWMCLENNFFASSRSWWPGQSTTTCADARFKKTRSVDNPLVWKTWLGEVAFSIGCVFTLSVPPLVASTRYPLLLGVSDAPLPQYSEWDLDYSFC
jgi:hypothetical protein